jgi:hypothetical protein
VSVPYGAGSFRLVAIEQCDGLLARPLVTNSSILFSISVQSRRELQLLAGACGHTVQDLSQENARSLSGPSDSRVRSCPRSTLLPMLKGCGQGTVQFHLKRGE